ncbi:hypothetical protein PLICRDRAFT_648879 [Plicaturopsis crispa FD-325 SS-3]|nr:hypothetical protein PLICRDRAFT_648879 [Plicaturopsis crispa FD-325 SS-3]
MSLRQYDPGTCQGSCALRFALHLLISICCIPVFVTSLWSRSSLLRSKPSVSWTTELLRMVAYGSVAPAIVTCTTLAQTEFSIFHLLRTYLVRCAFNPSRRSVAFNFRVQWYIRRYIPGLGQF